MTLYEVGDRVKVPRHPSLPNAGKVGTVVAVPADDAITVQFEDTTQKVKARWLVPVNRHRPFLRLLRLED